MARLPLADYLVIPDTNCLFTKEIGSIVSGGFENAWKRAVENGNLELVVPSVVRDELLARRMHVVSQSLANAGKNLETISKISGKPLKSLPTLESLRRLTAKRLDGYFKSAKAQVVTVPIKSIPWKSVLQSAIDRTPPFTSFKMLEDDSVLDKGFKDAVIFEAFTILAAKARHNKIKVLLTKDSLLGQAFGNRFGKTAGYLLFPTIDEFGSFLLISRNEAKKAIAQKIQAKVGSVFYSENDAECVYFRFKVYDEIVKRFSLSLDSGVDLAPLQNAVAAAIGSVASPAFFTPATDNNLYIRENVLESFEDGAKSQWRTRIEIARLFKAPSHLTDPNAWWRIQSLEKIRLSDIDVIWRAEIDASGEFSETEISEYRFVESKMIPADFLTKGKYGFPLFETPQPQSPSMR